MYVSLSYCINCCNNLIQYSHTSLSRLGQFLCFLPTKQMRSAYGRFSCINHPITTRNYPKLVSAEGTKGEVTNQLNILDKQFSDSILFTSHNNRNFSILYDRIDARQLSNVIHLDLLTSQYCMPREDSVSSYLIYIK